MRPSGTVRETTRAKETALAFTPLSPASPLPLRDQAAAALRAAIAGGDLAPGNRLPAVRELARRWGIGKSTVYDAIAVLEREGLLATRPNSATFVAAGPPAVTSAALTLGLVYLTESLPRQQYYSDMFAGIEQAASAARCGIRRLPFIHLTHPAQDIVEAIRGRAIDGIVYIMFGGIRTDILALARTAGRPVVVLDYHEPGLPHDAVLIDNVNMVRDAVRRLIGLGHRRIAYINAGLTNLNTEERRTGYRAALQEAGLGQDDTLHVTDLPGIDGGRRAMQRLLALPDPPTAAAAFNDLMAVGAIQAAETSGIPVPGRLSVMGAGGFGAFLQLERRLTTMRIDMQAMGQHAVDRLCKRISGLDEPPRIFRVGTWLEEGETIAPPPPAGPRHP